MDSTELWKQSLVTVKGKLEAMSASGIKPGCVYGVFSPEPIRQQQTMPSPYELGEVWARSFRNGREVSHYLKILRCDQLSVETLFSLCSDERERWSNFNPIASDLVAAIFGSKTAAQRILDLTTEKFDPIHLWIVLLFRLARLRIDGSTLFVNGSPDSEDIFQTLWPTVPAGFDLLPNADPSGQFSLYLPKCYEGALWTLSEAVGTLRVQGKETDQEEKSAECRLHFSPPLVLFREVRREHVGAKNLRPFFFAWSGQNSPLSSLTIEQNGESSTDPSSVRIAGLRPVPLDRGNYHTVMTRDNYISYDEGTAIFVECDAEVRLIESVRDKKMDGQHDFTQNVPAVVSIPTQMILLFDGEKWNSFPEKIEAPVRITVWSKDPNQDIPVLNFDRGYRLYPMPIRLSKAEWVMGHIREGRDQFFSNINEFNPYHPQQRITNVVQVLDDLIDASIKAVDITLSKGKEWFRQVIERTTPIFNETWKDGLFSQEKCQQVISKLQKINLDSSHNNPQKITNESPRTKKTMRDYSEEDKEKMIDRAIAFKRRFPWASNIVVAFHVARKWEGFKNTHLSRLGIKEKLSDCYKRFVEAQKSEVKSNVTVQQDEENNETPDEIAEFNEYNATLSDYLVSLGVPAQMVEDKRQEVIEYLTRLIRGFDQALSNAVLGEGYILEDESQVRLTNKRNADKAREKTDWRSSQNFIPAEKEIHDFIKIWIEDRNCAMDK